MSDMGAGHIVAALRERYPVGKGWCVFTELRESTGWNRRACDLFAFGTWAKHSFRAVAVEVKVTRSDFQREIEDPSKRAPWEKLAGECVFAAPTGLLRPDEMPEGWGLLEVGPNGAVRQRKAPSQRRIEPWPWHFVAMIARRGSEPPPNVSPQLWEYAGRQLGQDDLLEIARKASSGRPDDATRLAIREAVERERTRLAPEIEIAAIVREKLGWLQPGALREALAPVAESHEAAQRCRRLEVGLANLFRTCEVVREQAKTAGLDLGERVRW